MNFMFRQPYTPDFFQSFKEISARSARRIVPLVMNFLQPRSVIDVGCGLGVWLSVFREQGLDDILGLDGDYVRTEQLAIPQECFQATDLRKPLRIERRFDLAISLEVAEHLPPSCAEDFVDSLVRLAPAVLFSAAIPFQGGTDHLNEQWPDYWMSFFRARGHVPIDCIRRRIWKDENVQWYYAQNTVLYALPSCIGEHPALQAEVACAADSALSIVHPTRYLATADLEKVPFRRMLRALPASFALGIRRTTDRFRKR